MAGRWLPRSEGDLVTWFNNWQTKLNTYAATFGLTPADTNGALDDYTALQHLVNISNLCKTRLEDINEYKRNLTRGPGPIAAYPVAPTFPAAPANLVLADIIGRVDAVVARIKADPDYTTAVGEDLGIESPAPAPPPASIALSAKAMPNSQVEVKFVKTNSDGAHIESSVDDGPWVVLGNDFFSPYIDTRPSAISGKAEVRKYRARPLDGDNPIGDWSEIAQVSTVP